MLFIYKNNKYKNNKYKIKNKIIETGFSLKGFTLIEILIVIVIIIIIIGAGLAMLSSRRNYEYKAEVDKIYKLITDAQANATKSSPIITVGNTILISNIRFRLPTNMPSNSRHYIALFRINNIMNNNNNISNSLSLEYFERIRGEIVISNVTPNSINQESMPNNSGSINLTGVYNSQPLFIGNNNYPISYIALINSNNENRNNNNNNNNNRFLPVVFRTDGSLAANQELYIRITHSSNSNRFRTYYIGINRKNIRKYVR